MAEAIITLLVLAGSILFWWLQRKTDPIQEHRDRYEKANDDIAKADSQAATINSGADLDELDRQRLQNGKSDPK